MEFKSARIILQHRSSTHVHQHYYQSNHCEPSMSTILMFLTTRIKPTLTSKPYAEGWTGVRYIQAACGGQHNLLKGAVELLVT